MEIKFPKDFEHNSECHLSLGRIAVGPVENPYILRYTLAPNGNLMLHGSFSTKEFVVFAVPHTEDCLYGFGQAPVVGANNK